MEVEIVLVSCPEMVHICIEMLQYFRQVPAPQPNSEMIARKIEEAAWNDHDALLLEHLLAELLHWRLSTPFWKRHRTGSGSVP